MDENTVEQTAPLQEAVGPEDSSPLVLIREKELEISGRVLAAKREADEIVAAARRQAVDIVGLAESEGGTGAADSERLIREGAEREAAILHEAASEEASALRTRLEALYGDAVQVVLEAVTTI